ncbi:hypothetical protein DL766_006269 [Monosporascus sp. MC13-8B]|uniref:Uncharacterized protein n=1 Tax=Monosporascus cannonballus TaxID=155416 RepID=A0ABY0HCK6_9PEZI|nr:hypothetical protein DL762_003856 [Monosporascus cannonballus]RYO92849.1 hypothetical protein DL763_004574 [Monosporascus cannonballus]RYP27674.1 hypothetical protein DL766_006269 [Monosporascus sp. MC13-8B]
MVGRSSRPKADSDDEDYIPTRSGRRRPGSRKPPSTQPKVEELNAEDYEGDRLSITTTEQPTIAPEQSTTTVRQSVITGEKSTSTATLEQPATAGEHLTTTPRESTITSPKKLRTIAPAPLNLPVGPANLPLQITSDHHDGRVPSGNHQGSCASISNPRSPSDQGDKMVTTRSQKAETDVMAMPPPPTPSSGMSSAGRRLAKMHISDDSSSATKGSSKNTIAATGANHAAAKSKGGHKRKGNKAEFVADPTPTKIPRSMNPFNRGASKSYSPSPGLSTKPKQFALPKAHSSSPLPSTPTRGQRVKKEPKTPIKNINVAKTPTGTTAGADNTYPTTPVNNNGGIFVGHAGHYMLGSLVPASPLTPGLDSIGLAPDVVVPTSVFTGLEEYMTNFPAFDEIDKIWQLGIQYGIGLGVNAYKAGLMNELVTRGRLFGRHVLIDGGGDVQRMRASIMSRDLFDRVTAAEAGRQFVQNSITMMELAVDNRVDRAIATRRGFIGTNGMWPASTIMQPLGPTVAGPSAGSPSIGGPCVGGFSTAEPSTAGSSTAGPSTTKPSTTGSSAAEYPATGTSASVLSSGDTAPLHPALKPSGAALVISGGNDPQNAGHFDNGLTTPFTAGGTSLGGIDMTRLDGAAGLMANAINNASQRNNTQQSYVSYPLSDTTFTQGDWEDVFASEGAEVAKKEAADMAKRQAAAASSYAGAQGGSGQGTGYEAQHTNGAANVAGSVNVNNAIQSGDTQAHSGAAAGSGSGSSFNVGAQPMLAENKQGHAFVKMSELRK